MKDYVQITFLPMGAQRKRTCWAIKGPVRNGTARYTVCDKEGDPTFRSSYENDVLVNRIELVLCKVEEVVEKPARMNNHYGWLEITT
jgi:hypothetical protein